LDIHRDFCEVAIMEGELRSVGRVKTTPEDPEVPGLQSSPESS